MMTLDTLSVSCIRFSELSVVSKYLLFTNTWQPICLVRFSVFCYYGRLTLFEFLFPVDIFVILDMLWLREYEPRHDKTNKMSVRPAKTQISLGICPVWSESSLCAQWVAKDLSFLHADSEDSDQTGRMPRLIWVFVGRTLILLVLSCRGSIWLFMPTYSSLCLIQSMASR